jgi:hypothetical protein
MTYQPIAALLLAVAVAGCERGPQPAPPYRAESYVDTPGSNTARPGKHSTTTGRHGTHGEVGGGIDSQSGQDPAGDLDRMQEDEADVR